MTAFARQGLHAQVVRHLGLRVLRRDVKPGEAFPDETALSDQLGVSRTVVREALQVLRAKRLVESRPKTGTRVRPGHEWNLLDPDVLEWRYEASPDDQFLRDLTEVRRIIEPAAAGLAAVRATAEDVETVELAYRQMQAALADNEAFINADMGFHNAILAASGNSLLQQTSTAIGLTLRFSRIVTVSVPGSSEASMPLHWAVFEAIRDRDAVAAEDRMRELLRRTAVDIERALRGQGGGSR